MKTFIKKIPWLPLLLAAMLTGNEARAQDPFPYVPIPTDSAVWYVFEGARYWQNVPNGNEPGGPPVRKFGPFIDGETARYIIKDTVSYKGKIYNVIDVIGGQISTYKYYIRQDSVERSVYMRTRFEDWAPEYKLYEFNKSVGDTVHGAGLLKLNITSVVDSVKYLTIEGVQRKALYLRNIDSAADRFFDVWIEGIGSIYGLLHAYNIQNIIIWDPLDGELQCLQTRNGTLYTGEFVSVCGDTSITGMMEERIVRARWGIAPNPITDKITQANWPVREDLIINFELLDANGRVLSIETTFVLETITNLPPGVYCLRLNVKNEIPFIQRFIKL